MSELKAEGIILMIGELNQVTDSFTKLEFAIETEDQYPQAILFQLSQNRCDIIQNYKKGDRVTVHFNLRGKPWQKTPESEVRYFNTLDCWKLEKKELDMPF